MNCILLCITRFLQPPCSAASPPPQFPPMVIKIIFRPSSPPINFLSVSPQFFPRFISVSYFSAKTIPVTAITTSTSTVAAVSSTPPYGPSLNRGHIISTNFPNSQHEQQNDDSRLLNEENFTRVFDLAALRVPSEHCFSLESRLRGHLLNWPRIRNIARVPGDEIDNELKKLFSDSSNSDESDTSDDALVPLNRRIYGKAEGDGELLSPVLYRDKLARSFNSRGYAKFRSLAKMSRPKRGRQKKKDEGNEGEKKGMNGRNGMALLEVVEGENKEGEADDMSGLLGVEFKGQKRWRGSTRLLLLDETYVDRRIEDMPEAIKVSVFSSGLALCELYSVVEFHSREI